MQSELAGDCTCLDYFGENPDCALHGIATEWALKNTSAAEWQEIASEYRDQGLALRAQQPAASGDDPVAVIQEIIDSYSVAGANLLSWLTAEDRKNMPRVKSQTEWQDWANDVACRASFAAWREAKERLSTLPTYAQGRKDGIEEADISRARHIAAEELCRENWKPGVKAGVYEDIMAGKCDDEPFVRIAIRALGEPGK